jgi:dUTPase
MKFEAGEVCYLEDGREAVYHCEAGDQHFVKLVYEYYHADSREYEVFAEDKMSCVEKVFDTPPLPRMHGDMKDHTKLNRYRENEMPSLLTPIPEIIVYSDHGEDHVPAQATPRAAGYDIVCPYDVTIYPNTTHMLDTGLVIDASKFPDEIAYMLLPRSSSTKKNLVFGNTVGLIEPHEYCGPDDILKIALKTSSQSVPLVLQKGERIAQIVFFEPLHPKLTYGGPRTSHPGGENRGGFGGTGK